MYADLHVHTSFSVNSRTPEALVDAVKRSGIGLIAVCDHDTVNEFNRFVEDVEYALGRI